jgi:glyoxylase-like metal-dependent hydrolase (beta-lactamase superfamily II)
MARILVDDTLWPIVRVKLPPEQTDDEMRLYLDELRALRERRQPYALIIDANDSRGFTASQRKLQAEYIESGVELTRRYLKAFAFVAESAIQRGMMTAIFWLRRPEWPHAFFATVEEAKEWARDKLAESR